MAFDINKIKNTIAEAKDHKVKLDERADKIKTSYRNSLNRSYNAFIYCLNSDDFEDFLQELLDDKDNYDCDKNCFVITANLYYKRTNFRLLIKGNSCTKEKEYLINTNIDWNSSYVDYEKDNYFEDLFNSTMQDIYQELILILKLKSLGFDVRTRYYWNLFDLWESASKDSMSLPGEHSHTESSIELKINK